MKEGRFVVKGHGLEADADTIGGCNADGRRAAHPEHLDGLPYGFHGTALDLDQVDRQQRLIDQPQ